MTTTIKIELGVLCELLDEHIQVVAPLMEYGCQEIVVVKTGIFSRKIEKIPFEHYMDYWWQCMVKYYPYSELRGVFEAREMLTPETEVYIDCKIFDKIFMG